MAGKELPGIAHAAAENFSAKNTLRPDRPNLSNPLRGGLQTILSHPKETDRPAIHESVPSSKSRKKSAPAVCFGAQQHDYAVGWPSHLPQLAAVALAGFSTTRLDRKRPLPITLQAPASAIRFPQPEGPLVHLARHCSHYQPGSALRALDLFAPPPRRSSRELASRELKPTSRRRQRLYKNSSARSKHFFYCVFQLQRRIEVNCQPNTWGHRMDNASPSADVAIEKTPRTAPPSSWAARPLRNHGKTSSPPSAAR